MEIFTTRINGDAVNVIQFYGNYYFLSRFFGFLAVAFLESSNYNDAGELTNVYAIRVGNSHTIGSSTTDAKIVTGVKRTISKTRLTRVEFSGEILHADLKNFYPFFSISDGFTTL